MDKKKNLNNFEHASDDWYKGKVDTLNTPTKTNPEDEYELGEDQAYSNVARSQSEQEKMNFEFGRDNYFNDNGHMNTLRGTARKSEQNRQVGAASNQVSDQNYGDDVDFEFGQDYYPYNGVNSENYRDRQSKKNTNKNNRTL